MVAAKVSPVFFQLFLQFFIGFYSIFFSSLFTVISEPTKRKAMHNTCKTLTIVKTLMVYMNVFCVHVVQHHARHIGGMQKNIWAQLYLCKRIVG